MLSRDRQPMPDFVEKVLISRNLLEEYDKRPEYQRNDYLSWITRAKQDRTRLKRLNQMLDELEIGGVYMKMKHLPSEK